MTWEKLRRWTIQFMVPAIAIITAIIGLMAFLVVLDELIEGSLEPVDESIMNVLRPYHTRTLNIIAIILHEMLRLPYVVFLIAPFLIYLWVTRRRRFLTAFSLVLTTTMLLVAVIKNMVGRPRPLGSIIPEVGLSFPSGHAATGMVIYGLLGYIVWRHMVHKPWARVLVALITVGLITATGLSRIYLGVHYPSDVIAGWAVGTFILFGAISLLEFVRRF